MNAMYIAYWCFYRGRKIWNLQQPRYTQEEDEGADPDGIPPEAQVYFFKHGAFVKHLQYYPHV